MSGVAREIEIPAAIIALAEAAARKMDAGGSHVTYSACEHAGVVIVLARGGMGDRLRTLVRRAGGTVQVVPVKDDAS